MTAVWLIWLLAAAQAATGYRIAGVVVHAASGQPVSGARVSIAPAGQPGPPVSLVSGENGRFAFAGLARGKYKLEAQRRGLLPGSTAPAAIVTGPGEDTGNIVLRLAPPAAISGKVVDDAGDPVAGARVELIRSKIVDGHRELAEDSFKQADDTGAYRFSSLPAGSYFLAVSAVPWYTKFNASLGDSAPASMTHAGYAVRYYPNVGDAGAAEPLALAAGQEAAANFALLPVPAASVFVHCEAGEDLAKHYTLLAAGLGGNPVVVRQGGETGDLYNLWGVPAGHYTLRAEASDGSRTWYGATEFDASAPATDVDVALRAAPSLNGVVPGSLPVGLTVLIRASDTTYALPVDAAGRFSLAAIPPGRYRVSVAGDQYLRSWSADSGRRDGEMLIVPEGAAVRLNLSLATGTGRVSGVVDGGGHPVAGALVVLAASGFARAVRSNSDGSFAFRHLPPGDYQVFAVEDGADLEYANPAAIRPYLGGAQKVQVTAGASGNLRVDALR